jgi:hypothetical protein
MSIPRKSPIQTLPSVALVERMREKPEPPDRTPTTSQVKARAVL